MGDSHAPQGRGGGGEADPRLPGQEPQTDEVGYDPAAEAHEDPCPAPGAAAAAAQLAAEGEDQLRQQAQRSRSGGRPGLGGEEEARQQSKQRCARHKAAAQLFKKAGALDHIQLAPKEKAQILPVTPRPAVKAAEKSLR